MPQKGCCLESIGAAGRGSCVAAMRNRRFGEVDRSRPRHVFGARPSTAPPCSRALRSGRAPRSGVLVGADPDARARARRRAFFCYGFVREEFTPGGRDLGDRCRQRSHVPRAAVLGLELIFWHGERAEVPEGPDAIHCRRYRPCARRGHEGQLWDRRRRLGHLACGSRPTWRAAARIRPAAVDGRCRPAGLEV